MYIYLQYDVYMTEGLSNVEKIGPCNISIAILISFENIYWMYPKLNHRIYPHATDGYECSSRSITEKSFFDHKLSTPQPSALLQKKETAIATAMFTFTNIERNICKRFA